LTASDTARQDYLKLRNSVSSAQLATLSHKGLPAASHAPLVWFDSHCYLFLSELASHTRHLTANPAIGLILVEAETSSPFARQRITVQGEVEIIARDEPLFKSVLQQFHDQFGDIMQVIEPLADFRLFRVNADSGRFIRGFGQAYEIGGDGLDQLTHIDPRR
jgi:putative heme iron utilization protein